MKGSKVAWQRSKIVMKWSKEKWSEIEGKYNSSEVKDEVKENESFEDAREAMTEQEFEEQGYGYNLI